MGFPFLHNHILRDEVIFPISDVNRIEKIKRINALYVDCTGLLFNLSFNLPKNIILSKPSILSVFLKNAIINYIELITNFPQRQENEPLAVHLFFDGKSPCQKRVLQLKRDENAKKRATSCIKNNKTETGLSSIDSRAKRNRIIFGVAERLRGEIFCCERVITCAISMPDVVGESDIKIVKKLLLHKDDASHFPAIITCDSDIVISLELFRRFLNGIVILIKLPFTGHHCIFTPDLNLWLKKNSIEYKFVLFYFMFFFGCDYEVPIASGTKNQIMQVYNFVVKNKCKLSSKLLLQCWMALNIRPSKHVIITNLTLKTISEIIKYKRESVLNSLFYYIHGKDLPKTHITLLPVYKEWKLLLKNITFKLF